MVIKKPIRVLKYEDIRTNNVQAENRLKRELKEIEKKRKMSWDALSKETVDLKMGVRVQRYRVLKNDLQRKADEDRKNKAVAEAAAAAARGPGTRFFKTGLWQKATLAITKFVSAIPRERRAGNFVNPPLVIDKDEATIDRESRNKAYKDVYLMRLMQKLNSQPAKIRISYDENGKVKCTRQMTFERIRDLVGDLEIDQYNDGTLALAMRRFHKKHREAVRQVSSARSAGTKSTSSENGNPLGYHKRQQGLYNQGVRGTGARIRTQHTAPPMRTSETFMKSNRFTPKRPTTTPGIRLIQNRESTLLERLSLPKLSDTAHLLQPDVTGISEKHNRVFIPKSEREDFQRQIKLENESLMRIHKAEQKEEYIATLNRVNRFLGRRRCADALKVKREELDERETLIYDMLNREKSSLKAGVKLKNILINNTMTTLNDN